MDEFSQPEMTKALKVFMLITDFGLLGYWIAVALAALGWIYIPPEVMYSDYQDATVVIWNWSFLPLDVFVAVIGIASVRLAHFGDRRWKSMAIISLVLTFCAGLMALSFWVIKGDFDPYWWAFNLYLMLMPLPFLSGLIGKTSV